MGSIISIEQWFYNPRSYMYEDKEELESMVLICKGCGKPVDKHGYVYNTIMSWGDNSAWCSITCLNKEPDDIKRDYHIVRS